MEHAVYKDWPFVRTLGEGPHELLMLKSILIELCLLYPFRNAPVS